MAGIAKAGGNKLVVVIFPSLSLMVPDFKEGYPYSGIHALVKGSRSDNVLSIDLIGEFNRLNLTPRSLHQLYLQRKP